MDPEIPAQGEKWRFDMVVGLSEEHPELAWELFSANAHRLLASFGNLETVGER